MQTRFVAPRRAANLFKQIEVQTDSPLARDRTFLQSPHCARCFYFSFYNLIKFQIFYFPLYWKQIFRAVHNANLNLKTRAPALIVPRHDATACTVLAFQVSHYQNKDTTNLLCRQFLVLQNFLFFLPRCK